MKIFKTIEFNGSLKGFDPMSSDWTEEAYETIIKRILRKTGKYEIEEIEMIIGERLNNCNWVPSFRFDVLLGNTVKMSNKQRSAKLRELIEFERVYQSI